MESEDRDFSPCCMTFSILCTLIVFILLGISISTTIKMSRERREEMKLKIEQCKKGKVISIDEGTALVKVNNTIIMPGHSIPGSYEQTIPVTHYYVDLDNGIRLVSRDVSLKTDSVVGESPEPEFCNEDTIQ